MAGTHDAKIRERMLRETVLTLEKAISICRASEATERQAKEMENDPSIDNVDSITNSRQRDVRKQVSQRPNDRPEMSRNNEQAKACKYCRNTHQRGRCPAYGKMCNNCRKWNHFAAVCQSKTVSNIEKENPSNDAERPEFFVGTVGDNTNESSATMPWKLPILTSGTNVTYRLDTGSQVNIIPQNIYYSLHNKPRLHRAKEKLTAYDGNEIPVIGKCIVSLIRKGKTSIPAQMFDVPSNRPFPK